MDDGTSSGWSLQRREAAGAVAVFATGALLHFAFGWSGGSHVVAAIAPVNESVWEHLKMVLVPMLALGAVEASWVRDRRRLAWAKLVAVATASGFIVAFFYTYTGALGVGSVLVVDVMSFLLAVAGGQWLSHRIVVSPAVRTPPLPVSITALAILVVSFGVLTFAQPHVPLFFDFSAGRYGLG